MSKSLLPLFFSASWFFGNAYIRQGWFDILLTRPISPLFHLIAERFDKDGVGYFIMGCVLVVQSMWKLGLHVA